MFSTVFESWAPGVVRHYSKTKQKANVYTQKTLIQIPLKKLYPGFEQSGPGGPLLGSPKSIYYLTCK